MWWSYCLQVSTCFWGFHCCVKFDTNFVKVDRKSKQVLHIRQINSKFVGGAKWFLRLFCSVESVLCRTYSSWDMDQNKTLCYYTTIRPMWVPLCAWVMGAILHLSFKFGVSMSYGLCSPYHLADNNNRVPEPLVLGPPTSLSDPNRTPGLIIRQQPSAPSLYEQGSYKASACYLENLLLVSDLEMSFMNTSCLCIFITTLTDLRAGSMLVWWCKFLFCL